MTQVVSAVQVRVRIATAIEDAARGCSHLGEVHKTYLQLQHEMEKLTAAQYHRMQIDVVYVRDDQLRMYGGPRPTATRQPSTRDDSEHTTDDESGGEQGDGFEDSYVPLSPERGLQGNELQQLPEPEVLSRSRPYHHVIEG